MQENMTILWKNYKKGNDAVYRDRLVLFYRPFVKKIAKSIHSRMPKNVEILDLEGYGYLGLLDAIEKFDITKNIKFETYATYRIKGAIIDGVRKQDWLSRSMREKYKACSDANAGPAENQYKKSCPGYGQTGSAVKTGTLDTKYDYNDCCSGGFYMFSIDDPNFYERKSRENSEYIKGLFENISANNSEFAERLEDKLFLKDIISKLDYQQKRIIFLYYFRGKTFKEIGKLLNISESRVSQINKQILSDLRKYSKIAKVVCA